MRRSIVLVASTSLVCGTAHAATGLNSLEGLWIFALIGLVGVVLVVLLLALVVRHAVKMTRSDLPSRRKGGGIVLSVIAVGAAALIAPWTDFNRYVLIDNTYDDATEITKAYVEHYFELDDGRAFYLLKQGLRYFKPGRRLVVRETSSDGIATAFDIYDASGGRMFHERRRRRDGKKLWLPVFRTEEARWQLQERGPAVLLKPDWRIEDLQPDEQPVPWCCDIAWTRLLSPTAQTPVAPTVLRCLSTRR